MTNQLIFRGLLFTVAAIGIIGGGALSAEHFHTDDTCPTIGILPACYLVFASYGLIAVSVFLQGVRSAQLFFLGWTPVFTLALVGTVLQTLNGDTCPVGENGIPQCYLSLGMATVSIFLFMAVSRKMPQ